MVTFEMNLSPITPTVYNNVNTLSNSPTPICDRLDCDIQGGWTVRVFSCWLLYVMR